MPRIQAQASSNSYRGLYGRYPDEKIGVGLSAISFFLPSTSLSEEKKDAAAIPNAAHSANPFVTPRNQGSKILIRETLPTSAKQNNPQIPVPPPQADAEEQGGGLPHHLTTSFLHRF